MGNNAAQLLKLIEIVSSYDALASEKIYKLAAAYNPEINKLALELSGSHIDIDTSELEALTNPVAVDTETGVDRVEVNYGEDI